MNQDTRYEIRDCRLREFRAVPVLLLALVAGMLVPDVLTAGDWRELGPNGVTLSAFAAVPGFPDDAYIVPEGLPARIMYTSDAGASWTVRDSLADLIDCITVDPGQVRVLYCAGRQGKVYRSTDYGRFFAVRGNLGAAVSVRHLAINPADRAELWAACVVTEGDSVSLAVFRSTDSAASWARATLAAGHEADAALLFIDPARPNRVFCGGTVNGSPRLFATRNGADWNNLGAGLAGTTAFGLATSPTDTAALVCGTDSGIFRSTDSGLSWTLRKAAPAWSVGFASAPPHYGYAGSDNLVFRSNDNGLSWAAETTDFYGTSTRWLAVNPALPLELFAANGAGVFRTRNGGFDWNEITAGLRRQTVPFLYFHPSNADTVFTCPPGRDIIRSNDSGLTWQTAFRRFPGSGLSTGLAMNPRATDTIAVVTAFDPSLHITTNRGDSWTTYPIAPRFSPRGVCYHPLGPDTLYAWGGLRDSTTGPERFAVYKSVTQGRMWNPLLIRGASGVCIGFAPTSSGETLHAWGSADRSAVLYRSTNRGAGWTRLNSGVFGNAMRAFVPGPSDTVFYCATSGGVFRSIDRCANWTRLGLFGVSTVLPDTLDIDYVHAGTDTQGLFHTTNAGIFWDRDTLGFPSRSILLLQRHPRNRATVYCATAGAGLLGKGVVSIAEPDPTAGRLAPHVRPSLVKNRAAVSLVPGDRRTVLDLYYPDGRHACRLGDLCPTPSDFAFTRPAGLARGIYLLVVRSGPDRKVAKLVLTP